MIEALDIHVKGIVQGVGFRPFVYRLAKRHLVNGWVLNAADGVHIHAEAEEKLLDEFVMALSEEAPAASQVTEIELKEVPLEPFDTFEIRFSEDDGTEERTLVSPDLATCADCERELFDPEDRRYHYPFINCTNCGPRFTIIKSLPYDRASTSMCEFPMCEACHAEYEDPADRRFHAQPNACFTNGPVISFACPTGQAKQGAAAGISGTSSSPSASEGRHEGQPFLASGESEAPDAPSLDLINQQLEGCDIPSSRSDAPPSRSDAPPSRSRRSLVVGKSQKWDIVWGNTQETSDAIFEAAVEMLAQGKILAVKGLGGFHLVCDANNAEAVAQLRERKHRDGKAFAVMVPTLQHVREVCEVGVEEEAVLTGSQRPIVLLKKLHDAKIGEGVADKLPELGVMLPYTPVQHLLLRAFAERVGGELQPGQVPMLVMTSGNVHDEPIVIDDAVALEKLSGIADAILGNNREILTRFDDSVVRIISAGLAGKAMQFIRRARGYTPVPINVGKLDDTNASETIFATGPEQKNTFTFLRDGEAFVSQYIGDMENAETFDAWLEAKNRYEELFEFKPTVLACDMHPEYLTTKWAKEQAEMLGLPLVEVQHHHAHIASVIAEHHIKDAVLGFAFDGTGYGVDGAIWGGEVLLANTQAFERFANFAYVPMPGGAAAIKNPLRMAYGVLWAFDLLDNPGAAHALEELGPEQAHVCETMIEQGINTPSTSSVGRLFDAASALLGVCTRPAYEGEPAILLEAQIEDEGDIEKDAAVSEAYTIEIVKNTATEASTAQDTSVLLLDAAGAFREMLDDYSAGVPTPTIARRFHNAFVNAIVQVAQLAEALYDMHTVALSGGVFLNRYLIEHSLAALEEAGFTAAINRELPPGDGCISLGSAALAGQREH